MSAFVAETTSVIFFGFPEKHAPEHMILPLHKARRPSAALHTFSGFELKIHF